MQNEITELRNQVRTLKRIFCFVFCLFVFVMIGGCQSHQTLVLPPPLADLVGAYTNYETNREYNELTGQWQQKSDGTAYFSPPRD